jgi:hypothetical protein
MEAGWISAPIGGRAPFSIFRIQVWWDDVQVVAAVSSPIKSSRLQPHLDNDVEKLVGVVWSSRTSSGCGDLQIIKELHRRFVLLLRLRDGCGLLGPFWKERQRRHRRNGLEFEDEEHLKDFDVIFIFVEVSVLFVISFNAKVLFAKNRK